MDHVQAILTAILLYIPRDLAREKKKTEKKKYL